MVMSEGRLGNVLVVDKNDSLVAILSDGDLRRALLRENFSMEESVFEYATKKPKVITDENMLASDALGFIEAHKIQLLVVCDDDMKIKGVLHLFILEEV